MKIPLRIIRSEEGPRYRLGPKREQESCQRQATNNLFFTSWVSFVIPTWAVLCSLANARKCQLEDFCEKERYESCPVQRTCTSDAFRKVWKGENFPVLKLQPGSHERLAFEKPFCSVPETWGRMYDVLALRLCLYRGTISYFSNLVRMISVIDGSPRGYDFCITVQRFENTGQCSKIITPLKI